MELRQLRYFAKIAELKSFSEAAKLLNISQSTLSQQMQQLEKEMGVKLLSRNSRHVALTDVGLEMMPAVLNTLHQAETCMDAIKNATELKTGEITIGCTYTFSPLVKQTVLDFMQKFPGVKVNIHVRTMEALMFELIHHEIDIALTYRPLEKYPNTEAHALFNSKLAVVMNKRHSLAHSRSLGLRDLKGYKMALPVPGIQARNMLDTVIERARVRMKYRLVLETNDVYNLLSLVESSDMITILSEGSAEMNPNVVSVPLDEKMASMEGCYITRKETYVKHAVREFIKIINADASFNK